MCLSSFQRAKHLAAGPASPRTLGPAENPIMLRCCCSNSCRRQPAVRSGNASNTKRASAAHARVRKGAQHIFAVHGWPRPAGLPTYRAALNETVAKIANPGVSKAGYSNPGQRASVTSIAFQGAESKALPNWQPGAGSRQTADRQSSKRCPRRTGYAAPRQCNATAVSPRWLAGPNPSLNRTRSGSRRLAAPGRGYLLLNHLCT